TIYCHPIKDSPMIANFAQRLLTELNKTLPQLSALLPQRELQQALQSACQRLDLVTREEFDAQAAVLQRTREKLEQLEQRLASQDSSESPSNPHRQLRLQSGKTDVGKAAQRTCFRASITHSK